MSVFACYDTTGIQRYIFASNKLAENAGASKLVEKVLNEFLPIIIAHELGEDKVVTDWKNHLDEPLKPDKRAEIIYVGGGNAYAVFDSYESYASVTKAFLHEVLKKTAGIGIATAYVETDCRSDYREKHKELHERLAIAKGKINRPIPAGGQPITRTSRSTGMPATCFVPDEDGDFEAISEEQFLKRKAHDKSEARDFNKLERGNGMMAVVHVDGNSMGKMIEEYCDEDSWEIAVPKIRNMAKNIADYFRKAFTSAKNEFKEFYQKSNFTKDYPELPFVKLINDGDDITCVTAGRYGISFAARLLEEIENLNENLNNDTSAYPFPLAKNTERITACAGVVIFDSHFPFSSAYEMAEACCGNAKRYTRNAETNTEGKVGSFIDFHLHSSGEVTDLKTFRSRRYKDVKDGSLLCRPFCVSGDEIFADKYNRYSDFKRLQKEWGNNQKSDKPWSRSRLKELLDAFYMGDGEVSSVIERAKSRGYCLPSNYKTVTPIDDKDIENKTVSKYAMLFDVLELADVFEDVSETEDENVHKN